MVDKRRKASPKRCLPLFLSCRSRCYRPTSPVCKALPDGRRNAHVPLPAQFQTPALVFSENGNHGAPARPSSLRLAVGCSTGRSWHWLLTWLAPCMALRIVSRRRRAFSCCACACQNPMSAANATAGSSLGLSASAICMAGTVPYSLYDGKTDRGRKNRLPKGSR